MRSLLVLAAVISGLFYPALSAAVKIEEQVVGPAPDPALPSYKISERGVRYATLTMKGSRSLIVVDGADGPLFDELLATTGERSLTAQNAVIFSRDAKHYAYLARIGADYVLIQDGKEIYRSPYWISALRYGELQFSPEGKHLHFVAAEQTPQGAIWRVVMNGKAGPAFLQAQPPVFSPDESRWAYLARKQGARDDEWFAVVDSKETSNVGLRPVFTGDNRLVTTSPASVAAAPQLMIDGKAVLKPASLSEKVWVATTGPRFATAAQLKAGEPMTLIVDGKAVAGATDPQNVIFSPDGKRYMAICRTPIGTGFVVTDGKTGQTYQSVSQPVFTPDSTKAIYLAYAGSKSFLVVDGAESEGFGLLAGQVSPLALSAKGGRYGYGTLDGMNRNFSAVVDGKNMLPAGRRPVGDSFVFSPDGTRYAFATLPAARNDDQSMVVDGAEIPGLEPMHYLRTQTGLVSFATFSPDSKHLVWRGLDKTNRGRGGLVVDGQLVPTSTGYMIRVPTFTPDSEHLFWMTRESSPGARPAYQLYVDGRKGPAFEETFEMFPNAWEMGADGVLQFLAKDGAVVKRYRATATGETRVANMPVEAKAAEAEALVAAEKAKADAEAARKQAEADALAAQAKAKADAEAANAARLKARDEAIAAKQKAREDALAAKQKAREEALAKKKAQ
jgi:hypothetical protein